MKTIRTVTKHNLFIRFIKRIIRTFRKKPEITQQIETLPEKAIYIANHRGAAGPLTLIVYFPKILVPWGAHPMTEGYLSRWNYLYHLFYRQKLKYDKFRSLFLATTFGLISRVLYRGVHLIPSYTDLRFKKTISLSLSHLQQNNSILIFPEDSSDGYQDEIESFHQGFLFLAKRYFETAGSHIPIIPVYYHQENKRIMIGEAKTIADYPGLTTEQITERFKQDLNDLGVKLGAKKD